MLVLSRKKDESIIIGDDIIVTVVDIRGDKIRLAIDAPSEIPVHRREVYEAIKGENRRTNPYTQFRECLEGKQFRKAYEIFYESEAPRADSSRAIYSIGTKSEIDYMERGLKGEIK